MTGLIVAGVATVIVICAADVLAPKVRVAAPLVLVLVGIVGSLVPGMPTFHIEPDLVLEVILPPLLYSSAVAMPAMSFRRDFSAISGLSVALVLVSSLLLGLLLGWLVPGLGFVWGVALGAILSPTDAVATSIIKGRGVPSRVVTILEGESLLNDATALVILGTASGAAIGGFSLAGAIGSFVSSVAIALVIGVVVGVGNFRIRRRISSSTVNTILSFTLPFIASVPAELLGGSGLVAAVVTGLIVGFRGPRELPPEHRITTGATWNSIQMLLEGLVFLTMGLQMKAVLAELTKESVGVFAGLGLAALALVLILVTRGLWLAGQLWVQAGRAQRGENMRPRIEAAQKRLDAHQQLTANHLVAYEKATANIGADAAKDPEQLRRAYERALEDMAAGGDETAQRRLELREHPGRLREDSDRGRRGLMRPDPGRPRRAHRGRDRGRANHVRGVPDPKNLERFATRLRRASADIGYLVAQPLRAREGAVLLWAGMRGAVTVAAAQTLPEQTPHRGLLVFIAFVVAGLSLMVQGGSTGALVRVLYPAEQTAEQAEHDQEQRGAVHALLEAASAQVESDLPEEVAEKVRQLAIMDAQRDTILDARDDGLFDADVIEATLASIDSAQIALEMRGGPEG